MNPYSTVESCLLSSHVRTLAFAFWAMQAVFEKLDTEVLENDINRLFDGLTYNTLVLRVKPGA